MTETKDRVVWTEIPVTDMARAKAFYERLFGTALTEQTVGPDTIQLLPYSDKRGVSGHLYAGKPAARGTGSTIHLLVPVDLQEAMQRVRDGGGEVVSEVLNAPDGTFFYAHDTEGNSVGFFNS